MKKDVYWKGQLKIKEKIITYSYNKKI
jgi:hypothetical protein